MANSDNTFGAGRAQQPDDVNTSGSATTQRIDNDRLHDRAGAPTAGAPVLGDRGRVVGANSGNDVDGDGRRDGVDLDHDGHRDTVRPNDDHNTVARDLDHDGRADVVEEPRHVAPVVADNGQSVRQQVHAREKEEFGGFKFGSAFFGWLTATGTAVLLTALVAGVGTALGLGAVGSTEEAANGAAANAETIGIVGAIAVLAILFVAYFAGGYVAGRMARFSGAKQGVAVWLWAVIIAIVVAVIGAIAGSQFNILANLNSFPRLPFGEGELTTVGIITAVGALLISLAGAVLGGLAGMRFHRRVDRVGLGK